MVGDIAYIITLFWTGFDIAFCIQLSISHIHCIAADLQVDGKLPAGGQTIAWAKITASYFRADIVIDLYLHIDRFFGMGIDIKCDDRHESTSDGSALRECSRISG